MNHSVNGIFGGSHGNAHCARHFTPFEFSVSLWCRRARLRSWCFAITVASDFCLEAFDARNLARQVFLGFVVFLNSSTSRLFPFDFITVRLFSTSLFSISFRHAIFRFPSACHLLRLSTCPFRHVSFLIFPSVFDQPRFDSSCSALLNFVVPSAPNMVDLDEAPDPMPTNRPWRLQSSSTELDNWHKP